VVKKDGQRLWAIASVDVLSRLRGTHAARHRAGRDRGAAVERARQDRVRLRRGRGRMRGGEAGPGDGGQVDGCRGKQDKLISCGCGHQRRPTWPSKGQRTRIFQTLLADTDRLATLLLIDDLGGLYESRELSVGVVAGQARSTVRIRTIAKLRSTMRSQLRSTFSSSPSGPLGFWIAAGSGMWSSSSDSNSHSSGCCSRWWPERLPQPRWPP
jgi:hypothetical protein